MHISTENVDLFKKQSDNCLINVKERAQQRNQQQ